MKTIKTAVLAITFLAFGCGDGSTGQRVLPSSSGNINSLNVVIDNLLWENQVGETIRNVLGAPVEGLPQNEPLYSMRQMPPQVFSGFARNNRTVLKVEKGKPASISVENDVYARPQLVITVSGNTNAEIIDQINTNANKLIDAFEKEELKEKQRRIGLSVKNDKDIEDALGISLRIPSAYRIAKQDDKFFWIRKTTSKKGTIDIMLYELPLDAIRKGDSAVVDIVKARNAMGEAHIHGENEGSYMITETAYAPYIYETILDNKPTLETKGIWDMKKDWMSGPFINYAIEDKINNRYVVLEGYAYAPSVKKRDYMFELEAILKSVKVK
ncbi:DUF4837 family protein [Winogradskyella sp. 3972H.M.0a.05]|uniref:DUF4837 family protein n=1 Tax=Winogradskyella sp. 3972H.M.0a.05 TaxID=2950277 RepID=UPI0033949B39